MPDDEKNGPQEIPKTIGELYDFNFTRRRGDDRKVGITYGEVSDHVADRLQKELGLEVHGFDLRINEQGIRHAEDEHGADEEWRGEQLPLEKSDYEKIPEVMENPEKIKLVGYTRQNLPLIQFKKRVNGHLLVVNAFHGGKKSKYLEFQSMYKYRREEKREPDKA